MTGSLHIVRKRIDDLAMAMIAEHSQGGPVGVVLVQDGVLAEMPTSVTVYVNEEDVAARGITTSYQRVGYDAIARLVLDASTVMVW